MRAAHAHWLVAERHYGGVQEAHADGQTSRLEYHASEVISAAVETQRAAGVATTADALREVLDGLKPAAERTRQAEARKQLEAELDRMQAEHDRELTAVTRMDAANRERLQLARWRAEGAVPALGWWPALAADMAHASQGRLWLDETGTSRLVKTTADGGVVPGRRVDGARVAMLRAAGFLVTGTETETSTPLHPSEMGREALYLATLYPEGLYADERAAYEARYEKSRRPQMNSEDRKRAARRLPPLDPHAMRAVREKPVLLEDDQVPQTSLEDAARHADMAELAQRLGRWAAMSRSEEFDGNQALGAAGAQEPEALADESAPAAEEASEGAPLTAGNPAAIGPLIPAEKTAAPPPPELSEGIAAPPPTTPLAPDWDLALADVGDPHSVETATAAWALRGLLADGVLIELMATLDDDDAFARWKNRHMRYYGEGTGHVNKDLAPGDTVSHKHGAKHFEARIGDQTVKVTWDRIHAWLREATTPEALSLLQAAEEAGARLRGGRHGDSLLAATGELALSRDLRDQAKRLTTQVLDHITQFVATTPMPTGRPGKPSTRTATGASLFAHDEAPVFDLPGADKVRADLDRLIAYLPDPRADRELKMVPLSELRAGMVLNRGDMPVVITEIIRHPERCDIVGEFRGPIWPARIKHSVDLSDQDSDPLIPLAPLLPSLYALTGQQPEPGDDQTPGPLVEGHPALGVSASPRQRANVGAPLAPPVARLPELVWDEQRRRAHGQALANRSGERPPSARRRELDADDPFAQFTDNLEHQLHQLANHPGEHAAVANAAQDIRDTVTDLAARARAYSTERLHTAKSSPAELLQLTLEPSRTDPFIRVAMNAIMRAIDTAEDAVTSAPAKARVRAALAATVCSSPPHDPQGDSPRDFGDVLAPCEAVASHEQNTVAALLAGGESNQTHHRLRILRETTQAYRWMEDLSLHRFSAFDYIHPASPAVLQPGDEVMFAFDQDELTYAQSVAGYFPAPRVDNLAIGTAVVDANRELIPGFWWPHDHPEQTQRLTQPVALRDGARRPRPGEYTLHAGITAHLPELTAHQAAATATPTLTPAVPTQSLNAEPGDEVPETAAWSADAPAALAEAPSAATVGDEVPAVLPDSPGSPDEPAAEPTNGPASQVTRAPGVPVPATSAPPAPAETGTEGEAPAAASAARWRERLAQNAAAGAVLGIGPSAGESYEGYAGRFDGDYDITLPSGRYCYRTPGFKRSKYSVRYIPDPTRDWESKQIGTVSTEADIMPMVRRHAAKHADQRNPLTVELTEHEQKALDAVARGIISRSLGNWYRHNPTGRGNAPTYDWTTHALWTLSALGLIAVPPARPDHPDDKFARLTELGEQRRSGLHAEPLTEPMQLEILELPAPSAAAAPSAPAPDEQQADEAPPFPQLTKAASAALFDIARGDITEVDGVFTKRAPQRGTVSKAPSQKAITDLLELGLAERAGQQLQLSTHGTGWFAHHNIRLPATGLRDAAALDASALPPIDYTPLIVLPTADDQPGSPQPPAPAPLPADWHKLPRSARSEGYRQAARETADAARDRASKSTARDLAELAAGSDSIDRWAWRGQYPLAQYDENAAAALERLTDPVAHTYAAQAVHKLRATIEAVGREAAEDYVQRIRDAGADPVAMDKTWRTTKGIQADDTYLHRVRGIVITYLKAISAHAEEAGLDDEAIVHVLEDAAGWNGDMQSLSLRHESKHAYFPAAEEVAEAARFVAAALHDYVLGETDSVDVWAARRETWRTIEPRPAPTKRTFTEGQKPAVSNGTLVDNAPPPGPDASPADNVRRPERRFDLPYRVGQFVDHRDQEGELVTSRVVNNGINPILRDEDGHEFRALREFRHDRFVDIREDDGSALPTPAWTATLPDGYQVVTPDQVKPGDVVHDYRENGELWTSRLVIEVNENDGTTALTAVGLQKFSGVWLHYDHRTDAVLDETEQSRQLAEAVLQGQEVRDFAKAFDISLADIRVRPAEAAAPAPPQVAKSAPLEQPAAEPEAPVADAEVMSPAQDGPAAGTGSAQSTADDSTQPQEVERQDPPQERPEQGQPATGEETLERPETGTGQVRPEPPASAAAAPIEDSAAPAPTAPEGPQTGLSVPAESTPAAPRPAPQDHTREDTPDSPALLAGTAPAPTGTNEKPGTEPAAPAAEAVTPAAPGSQPKSGTPESENHPPRPPAAVREERTVATSAPPSAAAAEQRTAPEHTTALGGPLDQDSAAPYPDAVAYAAAHEALLTELGQHGQWLVRTPAAKEAATTLTATGTLGLLRLTALFALQDALAQGTDARDQRTRLTQQLGQHVRCVQLTIAKSVLDRAERSTSAERLIELQQIAFQGRFIAFRQQTENGEMELGHYIQHRAQQVTQQPTVAQDPAEQMPETAEEATTMAVDPDDDSQLPVFEVPGESVMDTKGAAPRLLAQTQAHLVGGNAEVSLLAHIHGRPVYALVSEPGTSAPVLVLGLTGMDEDGNPRAVTIPGDELARVAPERLLTAVTAWMNAGDDGGRPLMTYAPSASAPTPGPLASDRNQPTLAETAEPAPEPATAATSPAPPETGPQNSQGSAQVPASEAPVTVTAPKPALQPTPDAAAAPPAGETPTVPDDGAAEEQTAAPLGTGSSSPQADPNAKQQQEQDGAQQKGSTPAATTGQPASPKADPVGQLSGLARSALTELGITLQATTVLTADRTAVITLETSGNVQRDREIADSLRLALHEAIRQHPDQNMAAYRIDFHHTGQVGQSALQYAPTQAAVVPRERLIAANTAAAKVFAERLRSDPNAELARTYLTQEREFSADVQQKWGLGYAPSDRSAKPKRWDILCQELTDQGFTEDELRQAGLAKRSSRGTLIDYFDDRIMFPIHDENRDIVGFTGRRIDRPGETKEEAEKRQNKKYYNTSNDAVLFSKGDLVFGFYHPAQAEALAGSSGPRVSVEGPTDVLAVAEASATLPLEQRPVVGAPMGTAFTERQLTVLRGLDTDNPRPHIAFLDADDSGRKVLLDKWNMLVRAAGPTAVTTAPDAKDAAKLWKEGIKADGDGAAPVLRALEQGKPLLDAAVEAVLLKHADETERANHAFDSVKDLTRTRAVAAQAARYIHEAVQVQAPGDTTELEQAALTWAKGLDQEWRIPGFMTATAVLLGPGQHHEDYENEVYEQALDLLAADPEGYFANDSHVRSRQSASEARSATASAAGAADGRRPGQWPAGLSASGPVTSTSAPTSDPAPEPGELVLSMFLPSPADPVAGPPVEHTDRTTAAYALYTAVHERLGQHTAESPEPDRLPQPLTLGTVHGVELSTSGDDQTGEDPTVVVWLGPSRSDWLRLSYSRFVEMTGPELLAAVEWRAAHVAGLLGTPLSQTWRDAVRSIIPPTFPAQPTPIQFADLLDTIAQGPDASDERIRHRAQQAVALYTAGHPALALDYLAATDHIWVLRNDGSWIQEEAPAVDLSWEELDNGFSREAPELGNIAQAAAALPPGDQAPMAVDLTVAHHSAHEALAALRPYSIGLPNTLYEKITDLVAQMDACEPALRRLHGPDGEQLMNRAKSCFVRVLEGLATVASKIRLTSVSTRLERTVARLRGQDPDTLPAPRAVRTDRRMQDLAHIERDLERRMAAPAAALAERGELQEQWIINRARWRARYEHLNGQPPGADFLPDNGLIAGAPPVPNLILAHHLLLDRLDRRVVELRDTDPHDGKQYNPYDPTADLLNGVAWAYQQRLIGTVPIGKDPKGPISPAQLRQAALTVTSHRNASPLTLRRTMNVTAERADRLLHRLEEQQVLGPYRSDAPRTVLARPTDIDTLLARPATPVGLRTPPAVPAPAQPATKSPARGAADSERAETGELDTARIQELVSKLLAEQQKRSETQGGADPAERAAPAPLRARKTALKEAEANALATGQPNSLAPSQS
ncbi:hypothetical protein ACH419_30720 [Streptomyces bobili]|uniref:hypothetical protein n=1 Tax=Streptomyces bobili TaxID=67280 RepID=UPI0037940FD3